MIQSSHGWRGYRPSRITIWIATFMLFAGAFFAGCVGALSFAQWMGWLS